MNLLVVDDEYFIVQSILRDLDFDALGITSVSTAFSVQQAQDVFAEKHIDILLTDVEMPRHSGLYLIEWANEQGYRPLSLILTGHPLFDYAQRALKLHCFGYILKPATPDVLTEELKSAVDAVRLSQAHTEIPAPESTFLSSVKRCIAANISEPDLNRSFIADQIHMNPDYISFLFHKESGQALTIYILNERVELAKKLLVSSSMTIQNVTEQCGFSSTSYFHKQFKRVTGMTPQQYRAVHTTAQGS